MPWKLIIADDPDSGLARSSTTPAILMGVAALGLGILAALYYSQAGLTLSHYDAKAHLVVARRIIDSLTPGWRQVGAVWLPLPHLLNVFPVQIDAFYRTGASAVALSVVAFAVAVSAAAWLTLQTTGSLAGAATSASILALNPNLLYLQATPLTEPLYLGLSLLAVAAAARWVDDEAVGSPRAAGLALAGASLTRYDAWAVAAGLTVCVAFVLYRRGRSVSRATVVSARLLLYPALAVAAFLLLSKLTVGRWLVADGFFLRENPAAGSPWLTLLQIVGGLWLLTGTWTTAMALAGLLLLVFVALTTRTRASLVLPLVLFAAAALPAYAYFQGHPFRVRYAVPLVAAAASSLGITVGLLRRGRAAAAVLVLGVALLEAPPLDARAPMLLEAQWDADNTRARRAITEHLAAAYRGERILASMGSLAHYMQETSLAGFALKDFVHEGNVELWRAATAQPANHVGWILIREGDREGRDALGMIVNQRPWLLDGFERAAEGGTVVLYRRIDGAGR